MVVPPVSIITGVLSYIKLQSVVILNMARHSPNEIFNSVEHADDVNKPKPRVLESFSQQSSQVHHNSIVHDAMK